MSSPVSAPSAPPSDGRRTGEVRSLLTGGAAQHLESIHDYSSDYDNVANANYVLDG
ncbi:hypothetical protein [Candidimonas sp. SYP-B2681]|uniref:hypothetical protein n=1 Tax=Candidimonas sp. SYP-B2681 TaxID=2497686 RepID=UPI001F1D71C7|nr:hypothetical protein [Candidimonas sp. SYP-B2681]